MPRSSPGRLELDEGFALSTGIECSTPTIDGGLRMDELEKTGHYQRFDQDIRMVSELGLRFLRYGIPFHQVCSVPGGYDWAFTDRAMESCRRHGVTPIADLMHFGVPGWLGNYQNPEIANVFASYARAFAQRYPWVRYFTLVNEPFVTANFSASLGYWNEQQKSPQAFTRAMLNIGRCIVQAHQEVRQLRPDGIFIQSDSCEYAHAVDPSTVTEAAFLNELRFIGYELAYGRTLPSVVAEYLLRNGAERDQLRWFEQNGSDAGCIAGNDYYAACERELAAGGKTLECGERLGYYFLAKQYQERLGVPIMHTETNSEDHAVEWLESQWTSVLRLKNEGFPIRGFTWYGFVNHVDWDTCLREDNGRENACGLVSLERVPNATYAAYRAIIRSLEQPLELPLAA